MMETIFPEQSLLTGGLQFVNFFNGRLLTAEDLTDEQTANRLARRILGKALGSGVANGLWVTAPKLKDNTDAGLVVDVDAGVAASPRGDVLCLMEKTRLSLTGSIKAAGNTGPVFHDCESDSTTLATSAGLYLLTVSSAAEGTGRAPTSGLGGNTPAPCNTRYVVYGLAFHLTRLTPPAATANLLRNTLAYQAFGFAPIPNMAQTVSQAFANPFAAASASYGLLDTLGPDKLPICHVPLALIYRASDGIQFVDNWSVRRGMTSRTATQPWHFFVSPRRQSENAAAFLQFQEHLTDLLAGNANITADQLRGYFGWLPPAGLLPASVDWRTFLGSHAPARPTQVNPGLLADLLNEALDRAPFVLEDAQQPRAAVDVFSTSAATSTFVLFARSQQGRIRVSYRQADSLNDKRFEEKGLASIDQSFTFTASANESNLQVAATTFPAEEMAIFPNLAAGNYRVSGVLAGYQPLENRAAVVVGGQITQLTINLQVPELPLCLGVEFIEFAEMINIRMCLVTGTFQDAAKQSDERPWMRSKMKVVENLQESAIQRLDEWRLALAAQFPSFDIEASTPQLYVSSSLRAPSEASRLPITPQAYAVFGNLGIPLTVYAPTVLNREPISLEELADIPGMSKNLAGLPIATKNLDSSLIRYLSEYGIKTFEQVAGAWLNLIIEATPLSTTEARRLIVTAIKYLQRIDA
jgi:hypothetical protein